MNELDKWRLHMGINVLQFRRTSLMRNPQRIWRCRRARMRH